MSEEPEEPKIVVDDDWKSQVEKEKEQLEESVQAETESQELPPASFSMLVTTLAMQAGVALGQVPDPATGKPQINKPVAKHFIDTLALLEEKTEGNLEKGESEMLISTVHQLRVAFISMPDQLPDSDSSPGDDDSGKSTIELP